MIINLLKKDIEQNYRKEKWEVINKRFSDKFNAEILNQKNNIVYLHVK